MEIVKTLAERYELHIPEEELLLQANQWELSHARAFRTYRPTVYLLSAGADEESSPVSECGSASDGGIVRRNSIWKSLFSRVKNRCLISEHPTVRNAAGRQAKR